MLREAIVALAAGGLTTIAIAMGAALVPWTGARGGRAFEQFGRKDQGTAVVDELTWWWGESIMVDPNATILSGHIMWDPADPLRIGSHFWPRLTGAPLDPRRPARALASRSRTFEIAAWRRDAFGFPLPALSQTWSETKSGAIVIDGGIDLRSTSGGAKAALVGIPLRPVWPGAVLDVVAFGGTFFVAVTLGRTVTERRRLARGLCVRCKHPLAGLQVCPECGASAS